jgi:tricorn protease
MHRALLLAVILSAAILLAPRAGAQSVPYVIESATVSRTQIVFSYGDDLWSVGRDGGDARRLTSAPGRVFNPHFSPDGTQLAFTGEYDGNIDAYVMPADGGVPRRLTFHPAPDVVVGWAPDGRHVLFVSSRNSYSRFTRLYSVSVQGGLPEELPLPYAEEGSYSPDGSRIAYVPYSNRGPAWKHYRGGTAAPIWIAQLSDSSIVKIPRDGSNDFMPMWLGDRIYFLSDRNGSMNLFSYETRSHAVVQLLPAGGQDILSASAGPDAIVFTRLGSLWLYDLKSGRAHQVPLRIEDDFPRLRPHYKNVADEIENLNISPTGKRAVLEAHGEILTVPARKGDIRDLTNTPAAAERDPAWSPDGKWIAYFSDESGEYQLNLTPQTGMGPVRKIALDPKPSFYYSPQWSPDSRKIAYTDKRLNLWYIALDGGQPVKVDTDTYDSPDRSLDPAWSPDSKWIAYTKRLDSHMHALFLYSLETKASTRVTNGLSDVRWPQWDRGGKYLYFTASTDLGLATGWLDLSSEGRLVTRSVYLAVLSKDDPSPLAPESDEEKAAAAENAKPEATPAADSAAGKAAAGTGDDAARGGESKSSDGKSSKAAAVVKIDLRDIDQRILALPMPARNYTGLAVGKAGILFVVEGAAVPDEGSPAQVVHRFDLKKREAKSFAEGVLGFIVSADGGKALIAKPEPSADDRGMGLNLFIVATGAPPKPGDGQLNLSDLQVRVDPRAEWKQMYNEVWRIERDFFYDPGLHGLDLAAVRARYAAYLPGIGSRSELTLLFHDMLGNMVVGHMFVGGGDVPQVRQVPVGLLGADYRIENGHYRFWRIYRGENWNPHLRAPLTEPGVNVHEGDYLLAVNGRAVDPAESVYRYFQNTAGRQIVLRVSPDPDGKSARDVTVVPIANEASLRQRAWMDRNRRLVDQLSGDRIAYVYLPDTATGGYTNFNRYYFSQVGKQGAIIDERFNGGGQAADYIIDYLRRPLMNYWATREGRISTTPLAAIFGPKAMLINMYAGSGGDALPWYFRHSNIGPLIGERTWGGLIGIYGYPTLMDGGYVTAPRIAFFSPQGEWDVENHGVPPDIPVEFSPAAWRQGHDPQLEKAVAVVLQQLQEHPLPQPHQPAYPNYYRTMQAAGAKAPNGKAGNAKSRAVSAAGAGKTAAPPAGAHR